MTMRTLPIDASDDEIKALVVEWHELLADGRYEEALGLFPASDEEGPIDPHKSRTLEVQQLCRDGTYSWGERNSE